MTIIEIRPFRNGWKVFDAPGVEAIFQEKDQAIGYAETRACFRTGQIRVLDRTGKLERTAYLEGNAKQYVSGQLCCSMCKFVLAQKSPFLLRSDLNRCLPPIRPSGKSGPPAE